MSNQLLKMNMKSNQYRKSAIGTIFVRTEAFDWLDVVTKMNIVVLSVIGFDEISLGLICLVFNAKLNCVSFPC